MKHKLLVGLLVFGIFAGVLFATSQTKPTQAAPTPEEAQEISENYDRIECKYSLDDYSIDDLVAIAEAATYPNTVNSGSRVILCKTATFATDHGYHIAIYDGSKWVRQLTYCVYDSITPKTHHWYVLGTVKSGIAAMYFESMPIATANGSLLNTLSCISWGDNVSYVGGIITDATNNKVALVVSPKGELAFSEIIFNNMSIAYSSKPDGNYAINSFLDNLSFRTIEAGDPLLTSVTGSKIGDGVIEFTAFKGKEIGTKGQDGYAYFEFPCSSATKSKFDFYQKRFNAVSFYLAEDFSWTDESLRFFDNVNVSMDLNGHTFQLKTNNWCKNGSKVNIYDSGNTGILKFISDYGHGMGFLPGTELNIYGGTFTDADGIDSLFELQGIGSGAGCLATVNIYNGTFTTNTSMEESYLIHTNSTDANINIYKATFTRSTIEGGAIRLYGYSSSSLYLGDVTIDCGNRTAAVYCKNTSITISKNATIKSTSSLQPTLYMWNCSLDLKGTVQNLNQDAIVNKTRTAAIGFIKTDAEEKNVINLYSTAVATSIQGPSFQVYTSDHLTVKEALTHSYTILTGDGLGYERDLVKDFVATNPGKNFKNYFSLIQSPKGVPLFLSLDEENDMISSVKLKITKDATDEDPSITTNSKDATYQWYYVTHSKTPLIKTTHYTEEYNTDYAMENVGFSYEGPGKYKALVPEGVLVLNTDASISNVSVYFDKSDMVFEGGIYMVAYEPFSFSATIDGTPLSLEDVSFYDDMGAYDSTTGEFSGVEDDGFYYLMLTVTTPGDIVCTPDEDILYYTFDSVDLASYGVNIDSMYYKGTYLLYDEGDHCDTPVTGQKTNTLTTRKAGTYACKVTLEGHSLISSSVTLEGIPLSDINYNPAPTNGEYGDNGAFKVNSTLGGFKVYYLVNGTWTREVPAKAGTYDVKITRAEDDYYNAYSKVVKSGFVVSKGQAVIDVDTTDIVSTFGDTLVLPEAVSNFGEIVISHTIADLKNAGTYTVTYTVEGTDDYEGDTKTINVTINKKAVSEPTVIGTYTDNGTEQTVQLSGVESFMSTNGSFVFTNAGEYSITFTLDENHKWVDGNDGIVTFTVAEAIVEKIDYTWAYIVGGVAVLILFFFGLYAIWKKEFDKAAKENDLKNRKLKWLDPIYRPINKLLFENKKN